jgi:hypothetical protein
MDLSEAVHLQRAVGQQRRTLALAVGQATDTSRMFEETFDRVGTITKLHVRLAFRLCPCVPALASNVHTVHRVCRHLTRISISHATITFEINAPPMTLRRFETATATSHLSNGYHVDLST